MKSDQTTATADRLGVFESALNATSATFVEGKSSVWDYANPEHFSSLWKSLEDESVENASRVLIVWSQTPLDESLFPVSTVEHVSPLHWAACAAKKCPLIKVCVLDLNPTAHRSQYLYEHYLSCEKRRLSWVRVVQAAHLFGSEGINGEFQTDTPPIKTEAVQCRLFPHAERKRALVLAGHFVDRIRNELTSPQNAENRHAISNIIGPMVLRSGRTLRGEASGVIFIKHGKKSEFPSVVRGTVSHRCPLNSILRAAGLMCAQVSEETSGLGAPVGSIGWLALDAECEQAGFNPAELRITLVDDQWSQGWLAWINEGLGTTPVELQVIPDPLFLLHLLKAAGSESRRFSLSLDVLQNDKKDFKQDILLLDLRLFTGNPTAEREFLVALDDMLKPCATSGKAGVNVLDLQVVRRRLEALGGSGVELSSADHARYVTLLPRLIAQLDFSLPIIIFSSTGQRDVERQFEKEKFPSIIKDFSKPRHFQGADEEVVTRAEQGLIKSFENAIRWLRGRKLVQQIKARPLDQLEKARKRCAGHTHFELYFDESRISHQDSFRCAALLIGYKPILSGDYERDAKAVSQAIASSSIQLWNEDLSTGRESAAIQWKEQSVQLATILGERPVVPFVIARTPRSGKPPHDFDLAHPDSFDNALFDLVELILEIALVDVLPTVCGNLPGATVHVFGATRLQKVVFIAADRISATNESERIWSILQNRFGIIRLGENYEIPIEDQNKLRHWSFLYRSLWPDSFLPILARCLGNRLASPHSEQLRNVIKSVVGVQLPKTRKPDSHVRHQHYICDRLALFARTTQNTTTLGDFSKLLPAIESGEGFLGRRERNLLNLIDCARHLDSGNLPMAFAFGDAVTCFKGIFAECVAGRLQSEIPNLSSASFDRLCALLADPSALEKRPPASADKMSSRRIVPTDPLLSQRRPVAPAAQTDSVNANKIGPATREQFVRIAKHWKIRRFNNAQEYQAANTAWHTMSGFFVRKSSTNKITVFAQPEKVAHASLAGFIDPDAPNLFAADGSLCGRDFFPPNLPNKVAK